MQLQNRDFNHIREVFTFLNHVVIDAFVVLNENKECILFNALASKLFGYEKNELLKLSFDDLQFPITSEEEKIRTMKRKDGSSFPALLKEKHLTLANNQKVHLIIIVNMSKLKNKDEKILQLAHYDMLTGLPNRIHLEKKIDHFIHESHSKEKYSVLLFIDLNYFKSIIDTYGHQVGDEILKQCAKRLKSVLKPNDVVARFGEDEFAILLHTDSYSKNMASLIGKLTAEKIIYKLEKPFFINEFQYNLSACVGIISFLGHEYSAKELFQYANSALYSSKELGKGSFSLFNPNIQTALERKGILTQKLRHAIERHEGIDIFFQKQYDMNNDVVGIELLLRWTDKHLGKVSPFEFIPIAEETGLIIDLGYYVLYEAMKLLNEWKNDKEKFMWRISVNVSLKQFEHHDFERMIETILSEFDINPSLLRLEITESLLIKNTQEALRKIQYLKSLGFSFSIDDFGTGYSSLSYLKQLPVDELKIDKSFTSDILKDKSDENIVETILSLGQTFGFEVIAEGVECHKIKNKLQFLGCKYFQGYYLGQPESISNL